MKVAVKYFINEPARDAGSANSSHFFRLGCGSFFVYLRCEPGGYRAPVAAEVESKVINGAVKTLKTIGVFVVVEGSAG